MPGAQKTKKVNSESLNLQISHFMVPLLAENHHFCWLNLHFPNKICKVSVGWRFSTFHLFIFPMENPWRLTWDTGQAWATRTWSSASWPPMTSTSTRAMRSVPRRSGRRRATGACGSRSSCCSTGRRRTLGGFMEVLWRFYGEDSGHLFIPP